VIAACFAGFCEGQDTAIKNTHTIAAGVGYHVLRDDILKLSSQRLNTSAISYRFESVSEHNKKEIAISYQSGKSNIAYGSIHTSEFNLQYSNAFSIFQSKDRRWNNYTGYSIILNPQYNKLNEQYTWISSNSISAYNSLRYSWKGNTIGADLSLPLVGLGSRTDSIFYTGTKTGVLYNSYQQLSFTSLHNFQAVNVSLAGKIMISDKLSVNARLAWAHKRSVWSSHFSRNSISTMAGLTYSIW
jgi:hypothetical protein